MFTFLALLFLSYTPPGPSDYSPLVSTHYFISPLGQFDNGYPQEKYNAIIQSFKDVYGPIIEKEGGQLYILDDWMDGAVNMWAFRYGNEYWLEIPGGMSRYHLINEEAFVLSICHELGHLLGGPPKKGQISYEGQSDYYATLECTQRMLPTIEPIASLVPDEDVIETCKTHESPKLEICHRTLMGALSLTSYYAELEKSDFPKLSTPSQDHINETLSSHPSAQCRLDTFFAGYKEASRPSCWYNNNGFWQFFHGIDTTNRFY